MAEIRALVVDYGGVLTTPLQEPMLAFATEIGLESKTSCAWLWLPTPVARTR